MATAAKYLPPPDPDFAALAHEGYSAWKRDKPDLVAFDTETTGLAFHDVPFCVTAAWYREDGGIEAHYFELVKLDTYAMVREILDAPASLVGHNLKFDLQKTILVKLVRAVEYYTLHDTEALAHLNDEHRPKGLKDLMVSVLGWSDVIDVEFQSGPRKGETRPVPREKYEMEKAKLWAKKEYGFASVKEIGYDRLPRGVVVPYAITDARATLLLYTTLRPRVELHDDLWALYEQEMELSLVLLEMETAGMRQDREYVRARITEYNNRVLAHLRKIEDLVQMPVGKNVKEGEFNPGSDKQLRAYFVERGFERDSYDKKNLTTITHPLAPAILALRSDQKVLNTYFKPMRDEEHEGILNPHFRQHGTVTGRMSSGKQEG